MQINSYWGSLTERVLWGIQSSCTLLLFFPVWTRYEEQKWSLGEIPSNINYLLLIDLALSELQGFEVVGACAESKYRVVQKGYLLCCKNVLHVWAGTIFPTGQIGIWVDVHENKASDGLLLCHLLSIKYLGYFCIKPNLVLKVLLRAGLKLILCDSVLY